MEWILFLLPKVSFAPFYLCLLFHCINRANFRHYLTGRHLNSFQFGTCIKVLCKPESCSIQESEMASLFQLLEVTTNK